MNHLENVKIELQKKHIIDNALEEILQNFYLRMSKDTMIGFFFQGKDLNKIVKGQKELLLTAMGERSHYTGVPVNQAHLNLPPILEGHFNRRLKILEQVLREYGLNNELINTWVQFENKFFNVIVSTK